jgi:hypothetical protein
MFEILVDDLYVITTHSIVQPNLLGLVNVSDTEHVLKVATIQAQDTLWSTILNAM